MITRRAFIRKASAFSVVALARPTFLFDKAKYVKLSIVHTNDVHSRVEPFPMDGGKYQGKGGAAKRAALIKEIRKTEEHVLLLDAGDIFQGTPYFNFFEGSLDFKLMTEMGYDGATIGNHDFDAGLDGLHKQLPLANFPFINCNYNFKDTLMHDQVIPYKVFKKGQLRIGVLGVGIKLDGLVPPNLYGATQYLDPIAKANEYAAILKQDELCDYVICLSHLGYRYDNDRVCDIHLAQQSENIDLILGGHTHTFMDVPDTVLNLKGEEVMINQAGWAGLMLGQIDVYFEQNKKGYCTSCKNTLVG